MGAKPVMPDSPELDPESGTTRVVADVQVKAFPPGSCASFFREPRCFARTTCCK